jgi:hypothetical protein
MAKKKAKKNGLKKWFGQNKGKGWIDCKTGKPCGRKSAKGGSKRPYPLAALPRLNALERAYLPRRVRVVSHGSERNRSRDVRPSRFLRLGLPR